MKHPKLDNHDDPYWFVYDSQGYGLKIRKNGLTKEENEMKWAEVVRILDMSEAEFQATVELELVQEDSEEEGEWEGEGMEEEDYQEHENY